MPLRQWVLKITKYADKLALGLDSLNWPERTLASQKAWIGKSEGALIKFNIDGFPNESIEVFTTRADTVMGITYIVLAPESNLALKLTSSEQLPSVQQYLSEVSKKSDLERTSTGKDRGKTGVWTGSYAIHPLSGERLPVWIADYVLAGYGTGAVMAVPAHDERDFDFAKLFNLPVKQVVKGINESDIEIALPFIDDGVSCNSGVYDGLTTSETKLAVIKDLEGIQSGQNYISYKLRDWVFSRQRYWGEPIPIYFPVKMLTPDGTGDPRAGDPHEILYDHPIPVEDSELPLRLPALDNFQV